MTVIKDASMFSAKGKEWPDDTCSRSSRTTSSSGSDENLERGNWTGRLDFLLSCIGYAVGLGNIWRFPYLCYRNGGAVFLIPYLFFLVLCGMPLFFMEVAYGQFASLSPTTIWRISPLFKGVGYGMVIISGLTCIYYNVIIAWTLYYLFKSFAAVVPWSTCDNSWNTEACAFHKSHESPLGLVNGTNSSLLDSGSNVTDSPLMDILNQTSSNISALLNETLIQKKTASEEFWENNVLKISKGIENLGEIRLELFGCLALAWVLVFLCLCKGVKSSGRVVYFTATFPYIVLFILLIRGATLPGALEGIKFYVIPEWRKLLTLKIWGEAAMQIFYSVGAAWGALITMASYNRFHNNCYRDAKIVPILNCATSIFAGFVIFSIIGFMAHETGVRVEDVVTQGPGLVFVVYPEAVARMPFSPIWAVLFFLMLFTIGLDSQFGMFETMTSAFVDDFPSILKNKKVLFTACLCVVEFLIGIPCVTTGGVYFLQIMDWYCSTFSLMLLSFIECMVLAWIYGADRFYKDIELMIGYKPCAWWKICWRYITPVLIVCILLFSFVTHKPVTYGDYQYPGWAVGLGWMFALCSIVPLPTIAIYKILQEEGSLLQRIKKLVKPSADWGPALDHHREMYIASLTENSSEPVDVMVSLQAKVPVEDTVEAMVNLREKLPVEDMDHQTPL